ncbi:MAG: hypothetical protein AAGB51_12410 [Planctomycetota bacterium]
MQLDNDTVQSLASRGFDFAFVNRAGMQIDPDESVRCNIISKSSGTIDLFAFGPTKEAAFAAAAAKASEVVPSLSPDDLKAQLIEKQKRIDELEALADSPPEATRDAEPDETEARAMQIVESSGLQKDDLTSRLREAGVAFDGRSGVPKLASLCFENDLI